MLSLARKSRQPPQRLEECTAGVKSCASGSSLFTWPMFPSLPVVGTSGSKGKPEVWNPRERPLFLESKLRHPRSDLEKIDELLIHVVEFRRYPRHGASQC